MYPVWRNIGPLAHFVWVQTSQGGRPGFLYNVGVLRAAAVFILFSGSASARETMTLKPPVQLQGQVEKVNVTLSDPGSDPERAHALNEALFEQAYNTHHEQVDGLGECNINRDSVAGPGEKASIESMAASYHRIVSAEPPSPLARNDDLERKLVRGELRLQGIRAASRMRIDGEGGAEKILPDGALAAYTWKRGSSEAGAVVFQTFFPQLADWIGEFALETWAHEADHAVRGADQDLENADHLKREVTAMQQARYLLTQKITDYSWKFAKLANDTMRNPEAPEVVKQTIVHIGKLLDHCGTDDGCKAYAKTLYGDGHFHGDGHDHR